MPRTVLPPSEKVIHSVEKYDIWKIYLQTLTKINQHLDQLLRSELKLKLEDYKILVALSHPDSRTDRMSEIAAELCYAPSRLTYKIDKLIERSWVHRVNVEYDRRGKSVFLTEEGNRLYREATKIREREVDEVLFSRLSDDELLTFSALLRKIGASFA